MSILEDGSTLQPASGRRKSMEGRLVCGVDEAGRGALAGPIVAAAVFWPVKTHVEGVGDSKTMTPASRQQTAQRVEGTAIAVGVGWASPAEIDRRGIEWANAIVFTRAVRAALTHLPRESVEGVNVLIDGTRRALRLGLPQQTIVKGDATVPVIGAAAVVAKVHRDRYMVEVAHERYPAYGFDRHKGYGTKAHREALRELGESPLHRKSFQWR